MLIDAEVTVAEADPEWYCMPVRAPFDPVRIITLTGADACRKTYMYAPIPCEGSQEVYRSVLLS